VDSKTPFISTHSFSVVLGVLQVVLLVGYGVFAESSFSDEDAAEHVQLYNYLVGVTLMMLVGFGYLMTFLRWYGLGAVGLTMLVTCIGIEVSMLVEPLFAAGGLSAKVNVGLEALLNADFAVAAFLISFGGLIGKVSPTQLVVLVVFEAVCYCANKQLILTRWLNIADCGGTIVIHMFGAYFGLAASFVLGRPTCMAKEAASAASDVSALIGTAFLWLYWPSFVAGTLPAGTSQAELALTNTVLALLGSTVCTFVLSPLLSSSKIRPVDIQNATLAGGVSIGAVANLVISPAGALAIGSLAGIVSTLGYCWLQPALDKRVGLHDTCGIHNLHGMPSLLGGVASAIVPLAISDANAGVPGDQLAGVALTLLVAICSGSLTGGAMRLLKDPSVEMADDAAHWEVAEEPTVHTVQPAAPSLSV